MLYFKKKINILSAQKIKILRHVIIFNEERRVCYYLSSVLLSTIEVCLELFYIKKIIRVIFIVSSIACRL